MIKILENYKNRKCKTIVGDILQLIVFHNIARLLFFISLSIIGGFGISYGTSQIWLYLFMSGFYYCAGFVIVAIIYAWLINPNRK